MGRNDDEDIVISDPSVSGRHASIDIVELPGAGGKRVTLKVTSIHRLVLYISSGVFVRYEVFAPERQRRKP